MPRMALHAQECLLRLQERREGRAVGVMAREAVIIKVRVLKEVRPPFLHMAFGA